MPEELAAFVTNQKAEERSPHLATNTVKLPMHGQRKEPNGSVPQHIAVRSAPMKKAIPKLLRQL
jgi:hypothetical protein